jgi:hypothetical protein
MKGCYHCGEQFHTIGNWKIHLAQEHGVGPRSPKKRRVKKPGTPNVVHYGARMRKKLGLEYSPSGHLRQKESA